MSSAPLVLLLCAAALSIGSIASAITVPCRAGTNTACPDTATCCAHNFSATGVSCCPFVDAVCCVGSYGLCCPTGYTCASTSEYSANCVLNSQPTLPAVQVCTPGPLDPPSGSLPSVIIIGDSVSIGYTPKVAAALAGKVQVQHSPNAGGGGADDTAYGMKCIVNMPSFLATSNFVMQKWDVITFNFGLHNMDLTAVTLDEYEEELDNITQTLLATGSKLLYVSTTPFMPDEVVVQQLNARALAVTRRYGIPTVDLNSRVLAFCGTNYTTCSICDVSPCTYHYTDAGYDWIAQPLVDAIRQLTPQSHAPLRMSAHAVNNSADNFDYIDNGVIRVGIDLTRGGSIGWINDAADPTVTLINTHDMGREVQLSFYSGPSFYNPPTPAYPNGACDKLFGGQPWPWNPIGAGDIDGNHGEILAYSNNGTTAHVVTRPLQWACHNVSCDCTFEQQITLQGTGVRVDAILHNNRQNLSDFGPFSQELPAVYTNGGYYRLFTYNGTDPWTDAPVSEYLTGFVNNFWSPGRFSATEHWAALLDSTAEFGLGVVNPGTTTFLGGFSGNPGSGGPNDPQTGYIAPTGGVDLPNVGDYAFTFYLVLGNLETIRSFAQQVINPTY